MMDFSGQAAIVTGAAQGIGRATARLLAENGAKVALVDLNEDGLKRLAEEVSGKGAEAVYFVCDVSDEKRVCEVVCQTLKAFGHIDILINNAGVYCHNDGFVTQSSNEWRKKIDINIMGTLYFTRAVLPHMIERKYGRIVNLASIVAVYGIANMVDYAMTKGAIDSFTKALAREVTRCGVNVNAVSPGNIHESGTANYPDMSCVGRSGTPEECANVIAFLASREASFVSGQNYIVDGCRNRF